MGEEIACVSCYRGSWETCALQDVHSSIRTCKTFRLLTLQHISPPSREELNLFSQSFLCTAIGIHKPFLLYYCFQRKLTASSNFVLKAICFWHSFCTNFHYHTIQFILQNQLWHPSCCCKDSFQGPPGSTELGQIPRGLCHKCNLINIRL